MKSIDLTFIVANYRLLARLHKVTEGRYEVTKGHRGFLLTYTTAGGGGRGGGGGGGNFGTL